MVAAGGLTNPLRGSARVSGTRRVAAGASTAGLGLFGAGLRPRRGLDRQVSTGSTRVSVPAACSTVSRRTSVPEKAGRLGWLLSGELAGSGARPLVGNAWTDHSRRVVPVPHREGTERSSSTEPSCHRVRDNHARYRLRSGSRRDHDGASPELAWVPALESIGGAMVRKLSVA